MTKSFVHTPSYQGLASTAMPDYEGEPFSGVNGHFVGKDGFVVPADFAEFYERFPIYVRNWVAKRLRKVSSHPDVEDWSQTLLVHLCQVPKPKETICKKTGKVKVSKAKYFRLGFKDVIQCYNPWAKYGASAPRFFNYINGVLSNKFSSLRSKESKDGAAMAAFSLDQPVVSNEGETSTLTSREYLLMDRSTQFRTEVLDNIVSQEDVFVQQFREYVKRRDPDLAPMVDAMLQQDEMADILETLGITQTRFVRNKRKLVRLSKSFQAGLR